MFGWAAGVVTLLLIAATFGGGFGGVSAGTAFVLFLAFPVLFSIAMVALALRDPPSPGRRAEAERLGRLARMRRPMAQRLRRPRLGHPLRPAQPQRRAEKAGAQH